MGLSSLLWIKNTSSVSAVTVRQKEKILKQLTASILKKRIKTRKRLKRKLFNETVQEYTVDTTRHYCLVLSNKKVKQRFLIRQYNTVLLKSILFNLLCVFDLCCSNWVWQSWLLLVLGSGVWKIINHKWYFNLVLVDQIVQIDTH